MRIAAIKVAALSASVIFSNSRSLAWLVFLKEIKLKIGRKMLIERTNSSRAKPIIGDMIFLV